MANQTKLFFQKHTPDGLIEIWGNDPLRWLSLNGIEQTRINIKQPAQLASPVHRYFLAVFLFIKTPGKVLLGGLGGGALARYLYNKNPEILGDAIEINETIAQLAQDYFYFPEEAWQIIVADFRQWHTKGYDLMIIDIAEGDLTPAWLCSEKILSQLKTQLSNHGVLAINLLASDASSFARALACIRKIFNRQTLCISVPDHKNIIVFAFNHPPKNTLKNELRIRIKKLTALWGLEFSAFLTQLKKDNPSNNGVF